MFTKLRSRGSGKAKEQPPATMTLVGHLTELRNRIIIAMVAIAIGGVIGIFLYNPVLEILQRPYCRIQTDCDFLVTSPVEGFSVRLKVSAYIGLLIASPVVLWQLWRFVTPGLYPKEKRYLVPFVISGVLLFALGAVLALWTLPQALQWLNGIGGDTFVERYAPGKYLSLIVFMMLAFGIGFEFPVVLVFLEIAGILSWRKLVSWRRYAIVLIFFIDGVITPSADPISLFALAIPMCIFYELSILIGRFVLKKG